MAATRKRFFVDVTGESPVVEEYAVALADHIRGSASSLQVKIVMSGGVSQSITDHASVAPAAEATTSTRESPDMTPAANARIVPPPPRLYE